MTPSTRTSTTGRSRPHGVAALTVVMILFFVMALVAAYTNRNLVFEQRISANSYRAAKALEASDAAMEWTLAMLNGGRVDDNCQPSAAATDEDFRRRYLVDDLGGSAPVGAYTRRTRSTGILMMPTCINVGGALRCACPTEANPDPTISLPTDGVGTAFKVLFTAASNGPPRAGSVQLTTRGCASLGTGSASCYSQSTAPPQVDALVGALTTFGLVRALPVPPIAALTVRGTILDMSGSLKVMNADAGTGVTLHAGIAISGIGANRLFGPAGSLNEVPNPDHKLIEVADVDWFQKLFAMPDAMYKVQPGVVRCSLGCTAAQLAALVAGHPRNAIWVDGDLDLDGATALGSAADPLMLIVSRNITISAGTQIVGFVYAGNDITWSSDAASLRGAMVAKGNFTATAASSAASALNYHQGALQKISLGYGSFVRVPGSWNVTDFFQ